MDPETQALLERSRRRRELLSQRFDNMPTASPRKRRTPVHEADEVAEKVLTLQQNNDDDSPKRQCVRDMEMQIKTDTPAIQGVQSRIKELARNKRIDDQENDSVPVPVPRKSISSPPLERKALSPTKQVAVDNTPSIGRKGRFAALAQNINSWEDDLTHLVQKKETKPVSAPGSKSPMKISESAKQIQHEIKTNGVARDSPKKHPAPPTPRGPTVDTFSRSSPLRASKVELNRSPKPFTPAGIVSSCCTSSHSVKKSASDNVVTSISTRNVESSVGASKSLETIPSHIPVNAPGLCETPPNDLNQTIDEPTKKPVSQRFAAWEKKTQTPRGRPSDEPSKRPMSAKLAHFEKQIVSNIPKAGLSSSVHVERVQKQACTPALSASTPTRSISRPKDCDPSELPISQRMSQMQEKLSNSPILRRKKAQEEPTAYPVGARMSAWEQMSASSMVSEVKKVNPGEVVVSSQKPPVPPPVAAAIKSGKIGVTPQKSFKDSIQQRAGEIIKTNPVHSVTKSNAVASPVKHILSPSKVKSSAASPAKVVHSPSKLSKGTKVVQQRLIQKSNESNTTCSSLAAQSRADRMAELDAIHNRWKNGILRDDSSSDESKPSTCDTPKNRPVEGRREMARNKAREDFAHKLTEIGLDEIEKMVVTPAQDSKPLAKVTPSKATNAARNLTPSQTSSIYALIKKRDDVQKDDDDKKVHFDDSFFESDDEFMRKVPRSASLRAAQENLVELETFKKPETPPKEIPSQDSEVEDHSASAYDGTDPESESICSSRTSIEIDDDDISLKGFVSEAVRRESMRIVPSDLKLASQSSLESYGDETQSDSNTGVEGTSSNVGGYRPDNESMDDEDDEDELNRCAVGDLLDEAMDETSDAYDPDMDPNNVVLRKKQNNQRQPDHEPYDPDMDINNVVLRRKPQPMNTNSPVMKKTRSHAMTLSTDEDDDDDRPYSLSAYRKSVNVNQHQMEPIIRKNKCCDQRVMVEDPPMHSSRGRQQPKDDRKVVQERIKELQELVQQEQNVIMQTSNALNKCCIGNAYFSGSAEQVECNRLLLIACQKRQVYMREIQRLKETSVLDTSGPGPQGSLTICDIRLPLKKDFVKKIGTSHDNQTHFFILLIRNGCQVICTQMLSTHDPMMRGSLDFPNLIKIHGITGDFKLVVDIYGMNILREYAVKDKKRKTPKKGKGYATALVSPGGPTAVRTTSFSHVAAIDLTMKNLDKTSFHLDRLPHLSPLYGQIFMRLKCVMEAHVEEKGFLTMFEDVSGFGAWHRRWCVLSSNKLCVWKYPDDETRKDPMTIIDLKRCVTDKVGLVPRDICARPNTFEMLTVRQPLKGEHDTLVTKTHKTMTSVKHQMSADTKEERIMWCNKINRTLANLRTWNPDALKPITQSSSSSSYH